MLSSLNSPLVISFVVPVFVLGALHLLALKLPLGTHRDSAAAFAIIPAVLTAYVTALGWPEGLVSYGLSALFYTLLIWSLLTWLTHLLTLPQLLKRVLDGVFFIAFLWSVLGFPSSWGQLEHIWIDGLILLTFLGLCVGRLGLEIKTYEDKATPFLNGLIILAVLALFAFLLDQSESLGFILSMLGISLLLFVGTFIKPETLAHPLEARTFALMLGLSFWVLNIQGASLLSLVFIALIMFSRTAIAQFLTGKPDWMLRAYYPLVGLYGVLCAMIGLAFFDVFGAL